MFRYLYNQNTYLIIGFVFHDGKRVQIVYHLRFFFVWHIINVSLLLSYLSFCMQNKIIIDLNPNLVMPYFKYGRGPVTSITLAHQTRPTWILYLQQQPLEEALKEYHVIFSSSHLSRLLS